ncbi:YbfB/YjiJ family MFS transporter [Helicobacter cetorum]|uniref:Nitrite extrusion protein NarK n=1 Tax=Helicobacter cetorum (strain ATCC BAA-429 / MIT 00-7128) TaxID=182217 RepID=I0EP66_HELC0|nr:YbfB/YjiJ family MFS transporter [Helicobacter cetorum]AFI04735.1 nitrite extrusion protein NarK [Helicobacter cetorum MIT 00-7128]
MKARIFSCFLGSFMANGLARFGYVVMIPFLILEGHLSQAQSFQLGIAVLVGYVFGGVLINILSRFFSLEGIAKISFLVIALSFLACEWKNLPFMWLWIWRFLGGVSSASLMILLAPLCLPYVKENYRSVIGGFIFSGIGAGAIFSGFVLPPLALIDLQWAWLMLGGVGFIAFLVSLIALKNYSLSQTSKEKMPFKVPFHLWLLILSYGLNAIGFLPHTLFWVDYLVRDLHINSHVAGVSWAFFGFGAFVGSLVSGIIGYKIGATSANILMIILKAFSCFLGAFTHEMIWLNLSVFIMGATTIANVNLGNMMVLEIVGARYFARACSFLTMNFAIFQALFSYIFALSLEKIGYFWLFNLCGICLLVSVILLLPIYKARKI